MRYRLISIIPLILFSFVSLPIAHAQQAIYLIRHAEQMLDVEDPPLTEAGQQRAKDWADILRDADIKVVYTSKKRRTKQTGAPIAETLKVPLETMSRKDVQGLVERLRTRHANDSVLVVSHTRTIPKLVEAFGSLEDGTIQRGDYDNLIVIVPEGENDVTVLRLRY